MITTVLITLAAAAFASGQNCEQTSCNTDLLHYYKELGCKPITKPGACCASKFDCNAVLSGRVANKCYLEGRSYALNAILSSEQVGNKCIAECRCSDQGNQANLECVSIECPDVFDGPRIPGCFAFNTPDQCCATELRCKDATQPAAKKAFTCAYDGQEYALGESFYPKAGTCKTCSCQEGYDGTLKEPWCTEVNCGIESFYGDKIRSGCAPIFYGKNGCCPIDWRCPEQTDIVIRAAGGASTKGSTSKCVFGKHQLRVGDKLNSEKSCLECKCDIPPHVSCVQTGYC